jgi:hypothetical protein
MGVVEPVHFRPNPIPSLKRSIRTKDAMICRLYGAVIRQRSHSGQAMMLGHIGDAHGSSGGIRNVLNASRNSRHDRAGRMSGNVASTFDHKLTGPYLRIVGSGGRAPDDVGYLSSHP